MKNDWNTNWIPNELTIHVEAVYVVESSQRLVRKSFTLVTHVLLNEQNHHHQKNKKKKEIKGRKISTDSTRIMEYKMKSLFLPGKSNPSN